MKRIKSNLQNTIHQCGKLDIWKSVLLKTNNVWELRENQTLNGTVHGEKVDWIICPYCGLEFYENYT